MTILTTVFNYPDKPHDYHKLHEVFIASCKKHMPDVDVVTLYLNVPKAKDKRKPGIWTNTAKLRAQADYIKTCNDDVVIADCDMLCMRSAYHAFDKDFDIAYTVKAANKKTNAPINGGILFVKNTQAAKDWIAELCAVNDRMYNDPDFHNTWRSKYYGMNQTAMGYLVETGHKAKLHKYQTVEMNACDPDWINIDKSTVFVHIKGRLRDCVFGTMRRHDLDKIVSIWRGYLL